MKKMPFILPVSIFATAIALCLYHDAGSGLFSGAGIDGESMYRTSGNAIYKAVITRCESPDGTESHTHIECVTGYQECKPQDCPTTVETTVAI